MQNSRVFALVLVALVFCGSSCGDSAPRDEGDAAGDTDAQTDDGDLPTDSEPAASCDVSNGGCDPLTTCTLVDGSPVCGACPTGYSGDGALGCVNVDECAAVSPVCTGAHEHCRDTDGSFACDCDSGYAKDSAGACADIDECDADGCDSLVACTNTDGSYTCAPCPEPLVGDPKIRCVAPPPTAVLAQVGAGRSLSLCSTIGKGLPLSFYTRSDHVPDLIFEDPAVESLKVTLDAVVTSANGANMRVVVTDIGYGSVLIEEDTHFRASGELFDVHTMLTALNALSSTEGTGSLVVRYCSPMLPACSEVRSSIVVDDGSSVESELCDPAPSLVPESDDGASAGDDVTGDFSPTFTVSSTPSTTVDWLRDGVVKGTVAVDASGNARFTDDIGADVPSSGPHAYSVLHSGTTVPSAARHIVLTTAPKH